MGESNEEAPEPIQQAIETTELRPTEIPEWTSSELQENGKRPDTLDFKHGQR